MKARRRQMAKMDTDTNAEEGKIGEEVGLGRPNCGRNDHGLGWRMI